MEKVTLFFKSYRIFSVAIAAALLGMMAAPSYAQTPGTGSLDPSQLEKQFEPRLEPRSQFDSIVTPVRPMEPSPNLANVRLTLQNVNLEGVTVFSADELAPLYQDFLGQNISLAQAFDIAAAITRYYQNAGYVLALAVVPAQEIDTKKGNLRISVIEGYIDNIVLEGDVRDGRDLVQSFADRLIGQRPVHIDDLERFVLLVNDLPGMSAEAVLQRSDQNPGATQITLVMNQEDWGGFASVDNRGTRFIGPAQITAAVEGNSLLGLQEQARFRIITTDETRELRFGELNFEHILNSHGTRMTLTGVRSLTEPGFTLSTSDVESQNSRLTVAVDHPIIRSRRHNWNLGVKLSVKNSKTDVLGSLLSDDRLRVLEVNTSYDFVDRLRGINLVNVSVHQGLDVLGARESGSTNLSRAFGKSDFTKVNVNASRLQSLGGGFSALAAITSQYSFSQLLSAEEFAVGGNQFGRGYDPSEITGDHGIAGYLELRYSGEVLPEFMPSYQLYSFYDLGSVWRINDNLTDQRESAASIGAGIRFNFNEFLSGSFEAAQPLTHNVNTAGTDEKPLRFFGSMTVRF